MNSKITRHIRAIDGLRAIAVSAVILYHLGIAWIPGGFLGVDLFFVISGYVITRLLLDSIETHGKINLRQFYGARARRILPALFSLLTGTMFIIVLWKPDAIHRFLADLPYVLTATENWHLVALHQNYFQSMGRPPLLQHTWSLAVEAQFYFIWPLLIIATLRYFGKKSLVGVALAITIISSALLFLYSIKVTDGSTTQISHLYFGTDTHSLGMFLGAALAVHWAPQNSEEGISVKIRDRADAIGIVGFLLLVSTFFFISESKPALYQFAFPLAAICSCGIIGALANPASRFAPLLSYKAIIWIGERSYGIYLWHWVILQFTRPTIDLAGKVWAINIARILVVLALADISFRWIETPFRRGKVSQWFREMRLQTPTTRKRNVALIFGSTSILVAATWGASILALHEDHQPSPTKTSEPAEMESPIPSVVPQAATPTPSVVPQAATPTPSVVPHSVSPTPTSPDTTGIWVTGDSIILGVKTQLASRLPVALLDARVGRQIGDLIITVRAHQSKHQDSPIVLDIGNNNYLLEKDVRTLLDLLKVQPKVVVINTAVPRGFRDGNNRIIRRVVSDYSNVTLVDWANISNNHPEYFGPDGVHLDQAGIEIYVNAIKEALTS
jgi:peptidoglycan/LPS O-acetylase OafA/YrhL